MKKLLITVTATLVCVAAFAQGKVTFKNDTLHLVYFSTDASSLLPGDQAGAAAPTTATTTSGAVLAFDLWAGTSASSLTLVSTTTLVGSATAGVINSLNCQLLIPPLPGYHSYFFQIQAYDSSAGSYAAASTEALKYYGESAVFTAFASSVVGYYSLVQTTTPVFSTWAAGNEAVTGSAAGGMGSIMLQANVPEPTTIALAGLGMASLMIFRRRK